ncbi:MAG: response regulator transcription factor, partial [Acidimicrobiia bacterium]
MRVLVVEDEVDLAEAVALGLRRQGYAVDVALTGSEAVDKLAANGYDVVCLDWNLPDLSGRAICEQLGDGGLATLEGERPRVLMLTARDAIEDRVAGLDAGADDYLVKPFAFSELTARVRALLRREDRRPLLLRVGDLELDPVRHLSTRSGIELDLTPKEFALLHYFI